MAEGKKDMVWKLTEEDIQLGFEEAMPLMPSQVVAEACDSNSKVDLKTTEPRKECRRHPIVAVDPLVQANNRWKAYQKPRYPMSMSNGGPGLQAVFLDYTLGTGVFLPRIPGTYFQPSYSVFLPCHVAQALNLSVHVPFHLYQDVQIGYNNNNKNNKYNPKAGDRKADCKKAVKKAQKNESLEKICLPEEWIYESY